MAGKRKAPPEGHIDVNGLVRLARERNIVLKPNTIKWRIANGQISGFFREPGNSHGRLITTLENAEAIIQEEAKKAAERSTLIPLSTLERALGLKERSLHPRKDLPKVRHGNRVFVTKETYDHWISTYPSRDKHASTSEVAKAIGLSRQGVIARMKAGHIPHIVFGNERYVPRDVLEANKEVWKAPIRRPRTPGVYTHRPAGHLTVAEVADALGMSVGAVNNRIKRGLIPAVRVSRYYYVDEQALEANRDAWRQKPVQTVSEKKGGEKQLAVAKMVRPPTGITVEQKGETVKPAPSATGRVTEKPAVIAPASHEERIELIKERSLRAYLIKEALGISDLSILREIGALRQYNAFVNLRKKYVDKEAGEDPGLEKKIKILDELIAEADKALRKEKRRR